MYREDRKKGKKEDSIKKRKIETKLWRGIIERKAYKKKDWKKSTKGKALICN